MPESTSRSSKRGPSSSANPLSFLSPPGEVYDWRLVVAYEAATASGLLSGLPATPGQLAERLSLDERAVRILLEDLAVWNVVEPGSDGSYRPGASAPGPVEAAMLRQHAVVIRQWSEQLEPRLHGPAQRAARTITPAQPEIVFGFLAVNARHLAPAVVDACLTRFPGARRVLDLGGAHGEYSLEFTRRGLRATVQDLPHVIDMHESRLTEAGIDVFAGDFFQLLPAETFDLVFCAGVAPTYDAERNLEMYRRSASIIAPDGGLAVLTFLRGRNPVTPILATQMLLVSDGGDTHSEEEYRRWLERAAYASVDVLDLEDRPHSLLLAATSGTATTIE